MITAQEIREKVFQKAVFGGYDMSSVDEFLAEVANDLALLHKENAMLKAKMKVLANKVSEYRDNEEALRMAVVSAQKMGSMIEADARAKCEAMLAVARSQAEKIVREAKERAADIAGENQLRLEAETVRLEETKRESAKFIENMNLLCRRQLSILDKVSEMDFVHVMRERRAAEAAAAKAAEEAAQQPEPEGEAEVHETVRSIEESVARAAEEPAPVVRPGRGGAVAEDERPTRPFSIITDAEDAVDLPAQFSLDELDN